LRRLRLTALRESPHAFLSTFERERSFRRAQWRAEFGRGDWHSSRIRRRPVSLLGVTREPATPPEECYLEYLWVAPDYRRRGLALELIGAVLKDLGEAGVRTARLWVMDGNDLAVHLYTRAGFTMTDYSQPLEARPGRREELMEMTLG
jgi:ribosomal protein S18 acetylase RimI-like enzyme